MKYIVAYTNESTQWEWLKLWEYEYRHEAEHCIDQIIADFPKSMLGIFIDTETVSWRDRKPLRLYNKHNDPLYTGKISGALSGLINSRESDWF